MNNFLLSYKWKIPGLLLLITGVVLTIIYFLLNPRLEAPVFAVFSSFMEVKTFEVFRTNIYEELLLLSLLAGLFLLAFSGEKTEKEEYKLFRGKALALAVIINVIIACFSIIFVFGSGFLGFAVINIFLLLILYIVIFYLLKYRKSLFP
jgi:hypothetical protein